MGKKTFNELPEPVQKTAVGLFAFFFCAFFAVFLLFWIAPLIVIIGAGGWELLTGG